MERKPEGMTKLPPVFCTNFLHWQNASEIWSKKKNSTFPIGFRIEKNSFSCITWTRQLSTSYKNDYSSWMDVHFFCLPVTLSCWSPSKRSLESRNTLFFEVAIVRAISLAASICLRPRKAGLLEMALPISSALLASPCSNENQKKIMIQIETQPNKHKTCL